MEKEWQKYPIDCRHIAAIAGANHKDEKIEASLIYGKGKVVYCRGHIGIIKANFPIIAKIGPCVLLTASSDNSVTDELAEGLPSNVVRWFAVNNMSSNERVEALPIGFMYNKPRTEELIKQANRPWGKYGLLYICFTAHCKVPIRGELLKKFNTENPHYAWAIVAGGKSDSDVPVDAFYAMMATRHYTLSPPGAGPDCHRTWEAMALGSIPIVLRSRATTVLDNMPCMQVDDWEEVTQAKLEKEWPFLARRFNLPCMRKLSMRYWQERILDVFENS